MNYITECDPLVVCDAVQGLWAEGSRQAEDPPDVASRGHGSPEVQRNC